MSGRRTTYSVDGQIVHALDGSKNRAPELYRCQLHRKGRQSGEEMRLDDGEWAQVVTANVTYDGRTHVSIRKGHYGDEVEVPTVGVQLEFTIHQPGQPDVVRRISLGANSAKTAPLQPGSFP